MCIGFIWVLFKISLKSIKTLFLKMHEAHQFTIASIKNINQLTKLFVLPCKNKDR
jgi:hypothetical protein